MTDSRLSLFLLAGGLLAACAPKIPAELSSARVAWHQASSGPAATLVPAELHKARVALDQAEASFKSDPRGYHTVDLAYVAQRKAELSEALAVQAAQAQNKASADATYQDTQDAIMLETRSELAASQSTAALTATQLAASEEARLQADERAAAAMAALARLATVKEEARGLVITLSGSILFRSDESTLLPSAQDKLGEVAEALLQTGDRTVLIEGHTDSQGADAYNVELSNQRAEAVRSFLIQRGYDASRIRALGIGESRPVGDNATTEGRANNRRVEIIVTPAVTAAR